MNPYATSATAAYADAARTTASPERLLCMVYDRLLLDLERATESLQLGQSAHPHLMHAQDIVHELLVSLDHQAWEGAGRLASIYVYLHTQLVHANIRRDQAIVSECVALVAPLRDAWHAAADRTTASTAVVDLTQPRPALTAMTA
jgi:flagellar secretion chaperone FliS